MNHPVIDLLADGVRELVRAAWKSITRDKQALSADVLEEITERVIAAMWERFGAEFRAQIDGLALQVGLIDMVDRTRDVLDAFEVKGEFPPLGIEIEIVDDLGEGKAKADKPPE
jgi:hypothetical protein